MSEYIVRETGYPGQLTLEIVGEVVRCKGCKWFDITSPYGTVVPDAFYCKINDRFYDSEHFCAYGERRE